MRKTFLAFFFLFFLAGCATQPLTLNEQLALLDQPQTYAVIQEDRGFTDQLYDLNATFTIKDGVAQAQKPYLLYTTTDIIKEIEQAGNETIIPINKTTTCYLQERQNLLASVTCFEDHELFYYNLFLQQGRQFASVTWHFKTKTLEPHPLCGLEHNIFCDPLVHALAYDYYVCDGLGAYETYCERVSVLLDEYDEDNYAALA